MMNAFGVSGNLMSLGALDFGLLVDGAVIIVEAVMHKMSKLNGLTMGTKLSREQMDRSVEESSGKMMNAAVFGQIIILIVYLPILSLQGIEGKMFKPMAQAVSFAILGAFILSLTYVPMMSAFFLSRKQGHKENISDKMMQRLQQWYKPLLHKSMKAPGIIIGSSVVLFAAAVVVLSSLGGEFIPKLEEGDFAVETRVLTGSSLTTTLQESQKAVKILLKEFPEVEKIVTKVGTGEIPSDPMPIESADMIIVLKDKKEWTSAKTFDELAEKMGERVSSVPGVTTGFQYPVQMRFNELMTGARQDVVCKIFGDDLDSLARYAAAVGEVIGTVEGAKDLFVETVTGIPQLVISYNREAIARYGATITEVNRSVQAAYAGSVAGQIFENDKRFDLVIRLNESQRNNVDEIGDLLVELPSGQQVPLNVLAHVAIQEGPYQIQREDAQRRITIGFNVRGRDVQSIVEELQNKVKKQVQLPAGYYATYGGQFENLQQATKRLAIAVPAALLLIFVMLFFAFRKFKYCLLIFSAIPLSAIGGVFALWIRDMPFSISAGIGFIALFGVAVLNGIVLITEMNRLKAENNSLSIPEVIAQATETRLRPVLMTAAVASLGFLPMALSNGAGAEVQRPLATVVIGGLLSATLLTLFVLPSLYLLFEKKKIQIPMKPLLVIVMMLSTWSLQAQQAQTMKLEKLLELVKEKSPILKVGQLQEKYYTALKGTARDIPKTQLLTELGNYNSFNFDSRVSILQPFSSGMVYRKQELVLNSYLNAAEANTVIQQQVLEKIVRQLYLELQYLMARKKVLERADSVYGSFQRVAQLRFEKGESNLLEKTTLDNQVMQNRQILLMNISDTKAIQLEISLLLQDSISIIPADELVTAQQLYDTALLQQHPELQYYKAQEQQAAAETQLAKAKLKPEWLIGYNNQSLMGWMEYKNRSERFFTAGDRFSSVTLGMSIPFFNKAQKAKVEAANVQEQVNRANTDIAALRLKTQLKQALQHRDKFNSSLTYFKNSALPQSNIIIQTANLNYKNGQISYIEWATLVNQALGIQMQYADTQRDHQLNEIQLDYLLQKN